MSQFKIGDLVVADRRKAVPAWADRLLLLRWEHTGFWVISVELDPASKHWVSVQALCSDGYQVLENV